MASKIQAISTVLFLASFICLGEGQLDICRNTCPDYWMKVGEECFRYFGKPTKWHDAKNICDQLFGSNLPSIHSREESNVIYQLWKGLVRHSNDVDTGYWIGLRDTTREGFYEWTDYTTTTYMNWEPGQPDNYNNEEDCVEVRNYGNNDDTRQQWNDRSCSNTQAFFCRMPLP